MSSTSSFMVAGFLVTMGAVGNRIGRRRLLTAGAAAFGLASVAAAYSSSSGMLIGVRALLGIAGATLMPSTLGLISTMFRHPGQRTTAVSLWAACLLAGTAIGPVLGGVLLQFFWWGSVFLIGLPVMAVLVVAAPLLLPEHRAPAQGRLDLVSVALSLAAVLPAVYGLKTVVRSGLTRPAVLALVAGLACGALFVRRQRSAASPLLDLRLFRYRAFAAAVGILLAAGAVSGGIGFLFAQYLQLVTGLSPLRAGLWSLPDPAAMIACSLLCPLVVRRIRPGYVIGAGRTLAPVRAVAEEITAGGGTAYAAQVDALDEQAIERHVADVAAAAGRIDVLFNAIGMEDVQGPSLLEMTADDFTHPVITAARTQFLTARAVARPMTRQGSGGAGNSIDGALMLSSRHRWSIDAVCREPGEGQGGDVRGLWYACGR